jgi:hypothetical protein
LVEAKKIAAGKIKIKHPDTPWRRRTETTSVNLFREPNSVHSTEHNTAHKEKKNQRNSSESAEAYINGRACLSF